MEKELMGFKDELEQIEKENNHNLFMEEVTQYTIRTIYGKVDTAFDLGMLSMISGISNYSLDKARKDAIAAGKKEIYLKDVKSVIDEVATYHEKTLKEIQLQDRFRRNSENVYSGFFDSDTTKMLNQLDADISKMDQEDTKVTYAFNMAKKELGENATKEMVAERSMQILTEIKNVNPSYFENGYKK